MRLQPDFLEAQEGMFWMKPVRCLFALCALPICVCILFALAGCNNQEKTDDSAAKTPTPAQQINRSKSTNK